jgi:hypothetical protein
MWIFTKDGFVSIVQYDRQPRTLVVRGRVTGDVERLMACKGVFEDTTGQHDYRYRAYLDRDRVADKIAEHVCAIRYPNFKPAIADKRRVRFYFQIWDTGWQMQEQLA